MNRGHRGGQGPPTSIPPRWLHCPRKSDSLIGGKFLAFKTPLDSKYDDQVEPQFRFPVKMLFDSMKAHKVTIGLWIDLCNTDRWYNRREVEQNTECKYVKLQCKGRDEAPRPEQVATFVNICRRFAQQNPLQIIAVHCTHGFNRSGFLIASYLIETEDWSPDAAITHFAQARSPGIYKDDYIRELCIRYDGDDSNAPAAPHKPDWCIEDEDRSDDGPGDRGGGGGGGVDDDGHALDDEDAVASVHSPQKHKKQTSKFMEGVGGVTPVTLQPQLNQIQKKIQQMCGWRTRNGFPGSQPVSMSRDNMCLLQQMPYKVSWKADGTRYMMLIDGPGQVYFADRDNCIFKVDCLTFMDRKNPGEHLRDTLVDGEMVVDEHEGVKTPRYLIYDIIMFKTNEVGKGDFGLRELCIHKELIGVRSQLIAEGKIDKAKESFSVRQKQFWDVADAHKLLGPKFTKESLGHEPDGLIFQPKKKPYLAGRDDDILKWKPSSHNSIDFKLKIFKDDRPGMLATSVGQLFVGGNPNPAAEIKLTKELRGLNGKIVECKLDPTTRQWVFMRERTDKSFPNSEKTAKAVFDSIRDPVTESMLLQFIETRRFGIHDSAEFRPPPPKMPRHH